MVYVPYNYKDYSKLPVSWRAKFGRFGTKFYSTNKFGYNPSVGSSYEDVWGYGGNLTFLSTAYTLNIVSSSSDDDADPAGSGAHSVKIIGVDSNYNYLDEEKDLNGMSTVTTTNQFLRVYRAFITRAGTGEVNAGNITISATTGGSVQAYIGSGDGQTLMATYTIRDGYYGLVTGYSVSIGVTDSAQVELMVRSEDGVRRVQQVQNMGKGTNFFENFNDVGSPILITPRSDVFMRAKKSASSDAEVAASFSIWEVREEEINLD